MLKGAKQQAMARAGLVKKDFLGVGCYWTLRKLATKTFISPLPFSSDSIF